VGSRAPLPCAKARVGGCEHRCRCWGQSSCCVESASGGIWAVTGAVCWGGTFPAWKVGLESLAGLAPWLSAPPAARLSRSCRSCSISVWGSQNGPLRCSFLPTEVWLFVLHGDHYWRVGSPAASSCSPGLQMGMEGPGQRGAGHRLRGCCAGWSFGSYSLQFALLSVSVA